MSNRKLALVDELQVAVDNKSITKLSKDTFSMRTISRGPDIGVDLRVLSDPLEFGQNVPSFDKLKPFEKISNDKVDFILRKLVPPRAPATDYELAYVVQDWEGVVTAVSDVSFTARLLDRTRNLKYDTETAEIPLDQVDNGDRELVVPGGIFYLTVKRRIQKTGRHDINTGIVFRRLPAWTQSTIDRAKQEADNLLAFFEAKIVGTSQE